MMFDYFEMPKNYFRLNFVQIAGWEPEQEPIFGYSIGIKTSALS